MSQTGCNAVSDRDDLQRNLQRELLQHAVQTTIFSPYGGGALHVRHAVLLDGPATRGQRTARGPG